MTLAETALAGTGVTNGSTVHANLTAPGLYDHALRRGEGRLSADGAFMAVTGVHTGRSVQDKFVVDGPDPAHRIKVRLVTTNAWHALFARNMFIRPQRAELANFTPDFTILHAPEYEASPAEDGCRSSTCIALSFAAKTILIAGTSYAG